MKKTFLIVILLLIAAGCNKNNHEENQSSNPLVQSPEPSYDQNKNDVYSKISNDPKQKIYENKKLDFRFSYPVDYYLNGYFVYQDGKADNNDSGIQTLNQGMSPVGRHWLQVNVNSLSAQANNEQICNQNPQSCDGPTGASVADNKWAKNLIDAGKVLDTNSNAVPLLLGRVFVQENFQTVNGHALVYAGPGVQSISYGYGILAYTKAGDPIRIAIDYPAEDDFQLNQVTVAKVKSTQTWQLLKQIAGTIETY